MSNVAAVSRTQLIGPLVAIAVGIGVGFLWGWLDATRLAGPGGHPMDEGLARMLMTVVAGFFALVGVVLLATRLRRGGGLLLITAVTVFAGYQVAVAVGPK